MSICRHILLAHYHVLLQIRSPNLACARQQDTMAALAVGMVALEAA